MKQVFEKRFQRASYEGLNALQHMYDRFQNLIIKGNNMESLQYKQVYQVLNCRAAHNP